jgi:hypothetical protein
MLKINTVEDFKSIKEKNEGYVTVVDKPNNTRRVHAIHCPHVDLKNFIMKVIDNKEENGSYHWNSTLREALNDQGSEECLVCKK